MAAADKKRDVIMVHASKIRLEKRVYPRIKPSDENIKRYTELVKAGAKFPPILLDQSFRLMDGFHRWQAHINANKYEIPARIVRIPDDIRGFEIACQMNAIQGMPLTKEERAENARQLYQMYKEKNGSVSTKDMEKIAKVVGAGTRTVYRWLKDCIKEEKDEAIQKALELRRQGKSLREVAKETGLNKNKVQRYDKGNTETDDNLKQRQTDEKGVSHFCHLAKMGQSESQVEVQGTQAMTPGEIPRASEVSPAKETPKDDIISEILARDPSKPLVRTRREFAAVMESLKKMPRDENLAEKRLAREQKEKTEEEEYGISLVAYNEIKRSLERDVKSINTALENVLERDVSILFTLKKKDMLEEMDCILSGLRDSLNRFVSRSTQISKERLPEKYKDEVDMREFRETVRMALRSIISEKVPGRLDFHKPGQVH